MHPQTIFTKTAKGVLEVKNKTVKLPRDLGLAFLAIDGKSTLAELVQKSRMPEDKFSEAVDKLIADGYIKIFSSPAEPSPVGRATGGRAGPRFHLARSNGHA